MQSFMTELAHVAGKLAKDHFRNIGKNASTKKGRNDYVSYVDKNIEETLKVRIKSHYPEHYIVGEETHEASANILAYQGPSWIIDPIDGTTNFLRGIPHFAISIAYCDRGFEPRHAVVYDPMKDEMFYAERNAGLWLNNERVYTSECKKLEQAIVGCAAPFRTMDAIDDIFKVLHDLQPRIDDMRRAGSCALDLAYTAIGRLDAYWELGIWPWDTAAGELLVRCGGGAVTDMQGNSGDLLTRRSIVAAASPELHADLLTACAPVAQWIGRGPYAEHILSMAQQTS